MRGVEGLTSTTNKYCSKIQYTELGEQTITNVDHERMVGAITACGARWTGLPHSPKTNGDHPIEDNLGRYCPKAFETAKGKKDRWCCRE